MHKNIKFIKYFDKHLRNADGRVNLQKETSDKFCNKQD